MTYKEIITAFGIDQRELAKLLGYGGQDPKRTMQQSSPYRQGRTQRTIEYLYNRFAASMPKLSEQEQDRRIGGQQFLLALIERAGVDTSRFRELHDYIEGGANPADEADARIIQAEQVEWERLLREAGLV